ncbi:MAG: YifB family Mg chelatase-like AAA ATPase [Lautropia sp.]|nr:YifB family Mg chelatase-like AAA ATPase [Lautropia sp.]
MVALAVAHSRALRGLTAPAVRVEVHLANGLPLFSIVGLPQASVRESRERVRAALLQSGYEFPNRRITVNLAPADLPKDSGRFDLPIAIGILAACGQIPPAALADAELIGELSLSGALRPIKAALALACGLVSDQSSRSLILPRDNSAEAALCGHPAILGAASLSDVCAHLQRRRLLEPAATATPVQAPVSCAAAEVGSRRGEAPDLADVIGQAHAKRALEIAAAGHHHLLLAGPPGTGKSMLAARLAGLMPPLTRNEALASAAIASLKGKLDPRRWMSRPVRSPHHSVSVAGLIGGGQPPRPGEISLAHQGILFLDELPEFRRAAVEALREPLETGRITVARGPYSETFPADFLLVAAMNPCPCGYLGDARHACDCTPEQIRRYRSRLSGPLLDRFDLCVDVRRHACADFDEDAEEQARRDTTAVVAARVLDARRRQLARQGRRNSEVAAAELEDTLALTDGARGLAAQAARRFDWSMRALHRTLRVARTVADLAQDAAIQRDHVAEAVGLRRQLEPIAQAPALWPA